MKLEFFYRQACPFSARVREFIESNGLRSRVEYHDISRSKAAYDRLLHLIRSEQVPCLVVNGQPMLESMEIMSWLDENLVKRSRDLENDRKAS